MSKELKVIVDLNDIEIFADNWLAAVN